MPRRTADAAVTWTWTRDGFNEAGAKCPGEPRDSTGAIIGGYPGLQ